MEQSAKQIINKTLATFSPYGSLDSVVKELEEYKERYKEWDNLRIIEEYIGGDGGYAYYLRGDRLETDEERDHRDKNNFLFAKNQREYDLRLLKSLQEKYKQ